MIRIETEKVNLSTNNHRQPGRLIIKLTALPLIKLPMEYLAAGPCVYGGGEESHSILFIVSRKEKLSILKVGESYPEAYFQAAWTICQQAGNRLKEIRDKECSGREVFKW